MWETLPHNADWNCFKTPILQEILKIQHLHQVENCECLEVIHLFQSVRCARNKILFRTVLQNQKSFLKFSFAGSTESKIISFDAGLRLDRISALDFWDLIVAIIKNREIRL